VPSGTCGAPVRASSVEPPRQKGPVP
jgi:hypothetical protein